MFYIDQMIYRKEKSKRTISVPPESDTEIPQNLRLVTFLPRRHSLWSTSDVPGVPLHPTSVHPVYHPPGL